MAILTVQLGLSSAHSRVELHAAEPTEKMPENVTSETINKSQVEAAIKAVKDKGWDLNPFTVADEAKVPHVEITRSAELMKLIVDARGGDVSFQTPDAGSQSRVAQLEAEIKSLKEKLDQGNQPVSGGLTDDDVLNEQVKALLSSESDEQLKHLERELEQAYAQIVTLEEDKTDLTRSVTGLEKVNEAINARLRELEAESTTLKRLVEDQSKQSPPKSEMETINREMALRMEELVASNRANNEHIALLEATNQQHESLILELEAKLAELQQEADMLALQLQNAFNIGYQKGLSDSKPAEPGQVPQDMAQTIPVQPDSTNMMPDPTARTGEQNPYNAAASSNFAPGGASTPGPEQVSTGDQVVYTPGQYYEMHQQMPNVEMRNSTEQHQPHEQYVGGWGPEADQVLNFAKTGPYVASTFNPLESLSWRDLETVYSMGVLSIKDFSRNLTEYKQGGETEGAAAVPPDVAANGDTNAAASAHAEGSPPAAAYSEQPPEKPARKTPNIDYSLHSKEEAQQPETQMFEEPAPAEPPKSEGALDFIDELIDIDKLDIFESLEELEELGTIDVLNEPIQINFDEIGETTGQNMTVEAAQVSDEQLRELIKKRTAAAKEMGTEHEVRTPPAPDGAKGQGLSGLKKFVGQKSAGGAPPPEPAPSPGIASSTTNSVLAKHVPPEIRRASMLLGLRPDELTKDLVTREWKKQITSVHPDLQGGDTESSIALNTAKDTLLRWLDQNTPKLGGKFGSKAGGSSSPFTGKQKPEDKS